MRVLSYLVLLLMFSVASAQTPTILQGDYISNVFGNSNFILNPNAQTSNCTTSGTITCANVTVTNASITRVTTTPLVARTEFNVAIGTANGTATWATRAFDQGMKGQNCEARFTYRGFAATSKVHIKQGANTVATLNLTPATDPRIASINFPCGDLSTATTFVVTDTAILAGTNEISGIYTGLATNQANVAQAETVAIVNNSTTTIVNNTQTKIIFTNESLDVYDEYNPATGIFKAKRAGVYGIEAITLLDAAAGWAQGETTELYLAKNGTQFTSQRVERQAAGSYYVDNIVFGTIALAVGDEIQVNLFQNSGANINLLAGATRNIMSIKRFPTSSELVVTPERQNTFAAASWTGDFSATRTSTAEATVSAAAFATNRTAYGKAQFTGTANDVAITVENMPPGTYKIELAAEMLQAVVNASGGVDGICLFFLKDGTNTASAKAFQGVTQFTKDAVTSATQIVQYTTTATRTFTASYKSDTTNSTICSVFKPKIIITPLDQPSNSALYVQGPVLAAATGAAIPAGYVGEEIRNSVAVVSTGTTVINTEVDVTNATITLTPGVWELQYTANLGIERGAFANTVIARVRITDSANNTESGTESAIYLQNANAIVAGIYSQQTVTKRINLTVSKTFKLRLTCSESAAIASCGVLNGNVTGGITGDDATTYLRAIRVN